MASCKEGFGQFCSQLPPGFRFHPTDQELIIHYMRKKITASLPPTSSIIADLDLYKFNPWELPEKALFGEEEWFFFSPRDRKYPYGVRPNRAAGCGYWKATGRDKPIPAVGDGKCLGVMKSLIFFKGRPPKGIKTDWVMHEYRLLDSVAPFQSKKQKGSMRLDDWVLCRVRQKRSSAAENDGQTELTSSPQSFFTDINKQETKQEVIEERSTPEEWMVNSPQSFFTDMDKQETKQEVIEERRTPAEWSDQQLLGYLLGSCSERTGDSSDQGVMSSSDVSFGCCSERSAVMQQASPPQFVASVLTSLKRKLSFSVLDELMLMQPESKRQECWDGGQLSPIDSDSVNNSVNHGFEEFYF